MKEKVKKIFKEQKKTEDESSVFFTYNEKSTTERSTV